MRMLTKQFGSYWDKRLLQYRLLQYIVARYMIAHKKG